MKFETAYNKRASFFKNKKATTNTELSNFNKEVIPKNSVVEIIDKSRGLKVFFDIQYNQIKINNVSYENLELIK
jgi:hypothetical protein